MRSAGVMGLPVCRGFCHTLPMVDPRTPRRPLNAALVQLGAVFLGAGLVEIAVIAHSGYAPLWVLLLFVFVGWIYAGAGLLAAWRRPSNRLGAIMIGGGFAWLSAALFNSGIPALEAYGGLMATTGLAVVVHLLHAFPSGRITGRTSGALVAVAYLDSTLLQLPKVLFTPGSLEISFRPDIAHVCQNAQDIIGSSVMVLTAIVLARRVARYGRGQRGVFISLLSYGVLAVLWVSFSSHFAPELFGLGPLARVTSQLVVLAGVPVLFGFAALLGGFARTGEIDELGAWLATEGVGRPALAGALATALGDDSVALFYYTHDAYVDGDGNVAPQPAAGRGWVPIDLADRRVGAISYDTRINADPAVVEAAASVIAIAADNERLTADLQASQTALMMSSARIVQAGDGERRRIAQDLHDGLQSDLVLLAVQAQRIAASSTPREDAVDLRIRLDTAARDLRALVHGVMPALLVERGLYAAVEDLADRLPIPTHVCTSGAPQQLPALMESSVYFVVAEALSNAVKHSGARQITVRFLHTSSCLQVELTDDGIGGATPGRGAGLTGIQDRLGALGGGMDLHSPPGHGTRLRLELPCA